jgi:hypothetical protein
MEQKEGQVMSEEDAKNIDAAINNLENKYEKYLQNNR